MVGVMGCASRETHIDYTVFSYAPTVAYQPADSTTQALEAHEVAELREAVRELTAQMKLSRESLPQEAVKFEASAALPVHPNVSSPGAAMLISTQAPRGGAGESPPPSPSQGATGDSITAAASEDDAVIFWGP
jgi:hypothetical protein